MLLLRVYFDIKKYIGQKAAWCVYAIMHMHGNIVVSVLSVFCLTCITQNIFSCMLLELMLKKIKNWNLRNFRDVTIENRNLRKFKDVIGDIEKQFTLCYC